MTFKLALCTLAFPFALVTLTHSPIVVKKKKKPARATARKKITPAVSRYSVVIDKSDYELKVYDADGWLATYPVVFGSNNQDDKKMAGDRLTPEGSFRINEKRPVHKWCRLMMLDYPTAESMAKFYRRKANGEIPANATPGNGIAIHGTWPGSDWVVDNFVNWTEGCISLRNSDLTELFDLITVGTKVTITR